jgi:hypothetical protein
MRTTIRHATDAGRFGGRRRLNENDNPNEFHVKQARQFPESYWISKIAVLNSMAIDGLPVFP